MTFVPAGEIIGEAHNIRVVSLRDSPQLPDGEYAFIDLDQKWADIIKKNYSAVKKQLAEQ
ncbi:MAG: hypothetical protein PHO37_07160 [Kiritimatiellae bacterium]|nr:hypothetical protein [Kiritimatiellia bacterium]